MATISRTLPARDDLVRELLPRLGDGGTREHAEQAVAWAIERFTSMIGTEVLGRLVGVNESAGLLKTTRAGVLRWSNGSGRTDFPSPVLTLACGPHWDEKVIKRYARTLKAEVSAR